ncbi:MAG: DNA/RNA non-specific endonuclease, partial [Parabacteroides sp.]
HRAPAGDLKWSQQAMKESFYTSNICPQDHYLNQGIWNDLENKCRMWAKKHKSVWVVTGPVISKKMKWIGDTGIGIPEAFFKVLMYSTGTTLEGVAFVLENRNYEDSDLKKYAMPIDEAEKLTGIDFFHQLPDAVEDKMESELHLKKWGL